jgi:hypothetical protein
MRTPIENSLLESLMHIGTFPFEFVYHFLPWTALLVLFLRKKMRKRAFKKEINRDFILFFLVNISVYWVSPAIYARYLFMFLPLIFPSVFYMLEIAVRKKLSGKYIKAYFIILILLISGIIILTPLFFIKHPENFRWIPYVVLLALLGVVFLLSKKSFSNFLLLSVAVLLIGRIAFNFYVLPDRARDESFRKQKNGALVCGQISGGKELYLYGATPIQHASSYYIMRERKEILTRNYEIKDGAWYIIEKDRYNDYPPSKIIYEFETRIHELRLLMVEFEDGKEK